MRNAKSISGRPASLLGTFVLLALSIWNVQAQLRMEILPWDGKQQQIESERKKHDPKVTAAGIIKAVRGGSTWIILEPQVKEHIDNHGEELLKEMEAALLEARGTDPEAAANLAHTLNDLGSPAGKDYFFDLVSSDKPEDRKAGMRGLSHAVSMSFASNSEPGQGMPLTQEQEKLLKSQLRDPDPDVRAAAIGACMSCRVPDLKETYLALLNGGQEKNPEVLTRWLGKDSPSLDTLKAEIATELKPDKRQSYRWLHGYVSSRPRLATFQAVSSLSPQAVSTSVATEAKTEE